MFVQLFAKVMSVEFRSAKVFADDLSKAHICIFG